MRARNLYRDAPNRIHDDGGARQHGYAGALAAGVTIYGYLPRLVVETLGIEWIRRGTASVRRCDLARPGDRLETRGRVVRVYQRKGRGWVDLDLLIVAGGPRPIARICHTAIYRMPVPPESQEAHDSPVRGAGRDRPRARRPRAKARGASA